MARFNNTNLELADETGGVGSWEKVGIAVLMDIREELQTLNRVFACQNFQDVPGILRGIRLNTAKPKRRKQRGAR